MNRNIFAIIKNNEPDEQSVFITEPGGGSVTYGDMFERTARYANAMVELGVKPGDRVAVCVDKSVEALMLYLGCLRAGAVFLPLNVGYTDVEISYFVSDASPVLLICDPNARAIMEKIATANAIKSVETLDSEGGGSLVEIVDKAAFEFDDIQRDDDDLAAILYTSGTTGKSKGAMITHRNLSSNAQALVAFWNYNKDDILIHALPIYHVHGLFVATNVTLMSGASMVFLKSFDLDEILAQIPFSTVLMGVPTFYIRLLSSEKMTRELVKNMRLFISGSAPLSPEIHKEFEARTGRAILERYGMTETGMVTSNPYDGSRIPGTVGFALPDVQVKICDPETGQALDDGEVGSIEIRGPNVFKGYWQMPDKTKSEFRHDGFFISGDLGRVDEKGYLNIVGREKDLIITGGFNVYPAEVENALDAFPEIAESAVIGLPHADFGEGVTAVIVLKNGSELNADQVSKDLSKQLAKYKVPKHLIFVDDLPRNKMGKIQKAHLRDQYAKTYTRQV